MYNIRIIEFCVKFRNKRKRFHIIFFCVKYYVHQTYYICTPSHTHTSLVLQWHHHHNAICVSYRFSQLCTFIEYISLPIRLKDQKEVPVDEDKTICCSSDLMLFTVEVVGGNRTSCLSTVKSLNFKLKIFKF